MPQSTNETHLGMRTASLPVPKDYQGPGEVPRHGSPPHGSGSLSRVSMEHKAKRGRASQELARVSRKIADFVVQTAGGSTWPAAVCCAHGCAVSGLG